MCVYDELKSEWIKGVQDCQKVEIPKPGAKSQLK